MASKKYTKRRGGRHRSRKQRGGAGNAYSFGAPIVAGLGDSAEVIRMPSCQAVTRPGEIAGYPMSGGLPGMSRSFFGGGKAARRRRAATRRRRQAGGGYTFDLSASPMYGGTPYTSGPPEVLRTPCEGSVPNPLNPGPHTPSTQPPMRGGGSGGLGVDNLGYIAPTAGYSNGPSGWVASTGAPVQVQIPYDARAMNPACLKTGGGRRRRHSRMSVRRTRRRHRSQKK
jgi:hypothetical protein